MSRSDDPYAPPDPDARPTGPAVTPEPERPPFGTPTGPVRSAPPSPGAGGSRDVLVLVLGVLALLTSITLFGAIAFGLPAVMLGAFARRRARAEQRSAGFPVVGIVLGLVSLLVAAGVLLYLRSDLERYQDCQRESFSVAEDERCQQQLEDALLVG